MSKELFAIMTDVSRDCDKTCQSLTDVIILSFHFLVSVSYVIRVP